MSVESVWIHCSVAAKKDRRFLDVQQQLLKEAAEDNGLEIVGISREVSAAKTLHRPAIIAIITQMRRKRIDLVLLYDKTRIASEQRMIAEFQMICTMFHVRVITYDEMEQRVFPKGADSLREKESSSLFLYGIRQ